MRVAVACLLAVMLAGCFGHCEYTPNGATWIDEALYDAMDVAPTQPEGIDVGIPHVALRYAHYREASMEGVRFHDGHLHADIWDPDQLDGIRSDARVFLQNATALNAAQIDDRIERLLAAPRDDGEAYFVDDGQPRRINAYRVDIAADFNAIGLLSRLGYEGMGREDPVVAGWGLGFNVAKKHMALGEYNLTVDAHGRASIDGRWPELHPDEAVQADVRRVLSDAALPAPQDMEIYGIVC